MKIKTIVQALLICGLGASQAAFAASDAERIAQLEKQLKAMQEQLEALKQNSAKAKDVAEIRDQMAVAQKENVVTGDIPGSFRMPGTDTSIRVYGIAELNAIHEFKGDNGPNDYSTFTPYAPLRGSANASRRGNSYLHARTSRIGIEGATPSEFGQIGVKIEGDFNNDPRTGGSAVSGKPENIYTQQQTNSYGFRLRHAYVQVGPNWLFGQTWSTFMDIDNTPETVDFNGPIGGTFIRQPMIRYTYPTPEYGNFTAALENSVSYVLDGSGSTTAAGFSKSPDLILRWDKPFTWGSVSLRGVSTDHRIKGNEVCTNADCSATAVANSSKRGYGLAASGQVKTVGDDFLSWIVTGGTGIGRYLNYIEGAGYNPAIQKVELERAMGVVLGYQHRFNDFWRMNLAYGTQRNFDNSYTDWAYSYGQQGSINRKVSQFHIGGFWAPLKPTTAGMAAPVEFGLEYIIGQRETLDGTKGDMSRINFLARYNMN